MTRWLCLNTLQLVLWVSETAPPHIFSAVKYSTSQSVEEKQHLFAVYSLVVVADFDASASQFLKSLWIK